LPPLPEPSDAVFWQAAGGVGFVSFCILGFVVAIRAMAFFAEDAPAWFWHPAQTLIHSLAIIAVCAHTALLASDPGVVQRTPASTKPVPPAVAERLRTGETLEGMENQEMEREPDGTYCVRCCVWRRPQPPLKHACGTLVGAACPDCDHVATEVCRVLHLGRKAPAHHCRQCQRCVVDFDHHCGVLGRCIAGTGLSSGNMRFFLLLLICGQLASFTTAAGLVVALYKYFGWAGVKWLMGAAGAYMCLSCCVLAFARASQRQRMRGMSAVHM